MKNAVLNRGSLISDCFGMVTIGVQLYLLFRWLVPDDGFRIIWGSLAYVVLAIVALYFWHKEKFSVEHLTEPSDWCIAIAASVVVGAVSFGIDIIIGLTSNPKLPPIEAGTKAGSPFGFPLTVMLCPGFTMIAIAGFLRALLIQAMAIE